MTVFPLFPTFFQNRTIKKISTAYRSSIYQQTRPTERGVRGLISTSGSCRPECRARRAARGRGRAECCYRSEYIPLEVGLAFIISFNILTAPLVDLYANYYLVKVEKTVSHRCVALLYQCLHEREQCRTIACRVVPSCQNSQP